MNQTTVMTKNELRDCMRQMVEYILPDEEHDEDVIENYTETLVSIAENYNSTNL